ncbi:MAG: PKD domain-containing protein, partial [Bacteroidota bacterium]|nr:PKD domain-containing protein [Bacteroidota bacterium]MDX5431920.1 PKD domain-containing protein [Bacteroidota bacterium]MDX5470635.1 PKD domain-containing protein [Bacteroidota bacterium]
GTQRVNNVNLHRITDNFRVHVLIECMSPAGAAYFSPGAAGFLTPAIDLFNYLYTSSSSSICTSLELSSFYNVFLNHTVSSTSPYCAGDSIALSATGGDTYSWTGPSAFSSALQNPTLSSTGILDTNTYSVTITGTAGCSVLDSTLVVVGSQPIATIDTSAGTIICTGDSILLKAENSAGYTLAWYESGAPLSGASDSLFYATTTGNYSVIYSNVYGCKDTSAVVNIQIGTLPNSTFTNPGNDSICAGSSVLLSADLGGYDYQWLRDGSAIGGATSSTYSANVAGSYQLITHTNGICADTSAAQTLTVIALPSITLSSASTSICAGDTLSITSTGSGIQSYLWQKDGSTISGATLDSLQVTAAGAYRSIVSNSFGCLDTSNTITITSTPLPSVSLTITGDTTFCDYDDVTLSIPNTPGATYVWHKDGAPLGNNTISATVNATGVYRVIAISGNCRDTSLEVNVTVHTTNTVTLNTTTSNLCQGDSVAVAAVHSGSVSYEWQKDGLSNGNTSNMMVVGDSGLYRVIVTNANACIDTSDVFKARVFAVPTASFSLLNDSQCLSGNSFPFVNASTGGVGTLNYAWDFGDGATSTSTNPAHIYSTAGNYDVTLITSGDNSCQD